MKIRKAEIKDLSDILRIYAYARAFMKENGNPDQWGNVYPSLEMVREDIEKGICYVCAEEKHIVGVFVFFKGEDPTYRIIREGKWHRNIPYGVLHRVASDGSTKGISKLCFDFAKEHCDYLRIDTHKDNIPMQNTLAKTGSVNAELLTLMTIPTMVPRESPMTGKPEKKILQRRILS